MTIFMKFEADMQLQRKQTKVVSKYIIGREKSSAYTWMSSTGIYSKQKITDIGKAVTSLIPPPYKALGTQWGALTIRGSTCYQAAHFPTL